MNGTTRVYAVIAATMLVSASLIGSIQAAPSDPSSGATPGKVPEPAGFHQGAMHGYTPNSVAGAAVIDTAGLAKLRAEAHPLIVVDVAEADRKPAGMAASTLWMPAHRSIPEAIWLPGAGSGSVEAGFVDAFKLRFEALTGGNRAMPIVAFCHPECWGSWNAAKRLVGLGYTKVYWYPDGMEGWQAAYDTTIVKADAQWIATTSKALSQ